MVNFDGQVVAHSSASWEMAAHPLVSEICDAILGRQIVTMDRRSMQEQLVRTDREPFTQHPWQLELSQMITIQPPTAAQPLHRDDGKFVFDFRGMLDTQVGCIWALEDFTEQIGATRVVPGTWDPTT